MSGTGYDLLPFRGKCPQNVKGAHPQPHSQKPERETFLPCFTTTTPPRQKCFPQTTILRGKIDRSFLNWLAACPSKFVGYRHVWTGRKQCQQVPAKIKRSQVKEAPQTRTHIASASRTQPTEKSKFDQNTVLGRFNLPSQGRPQPLWSHRNWSGLLELHGLVGRLGEAGPRTWAPKPPLQTTKA